MTDDNTRAEPGPHDSPRTRDWSGSEAARVAGQSRRRARSATLRARSMVDRWLA